MPGSARGRGLVFPARCYETVTWSCHCRDAIMQRGEVWKQAASDWAVTSALPLPMASNVASTGWSLG